jgi:hypothetical protein
MNSASQQAKGILFGALELSGALQRHAYLDRKCASSTDLRAEVEQLLVIQAEADRFFLELSWQLNLVLSNASETKD